MLEATVVELAVVGGSLSGVGGSLAAAAVVVVKPVPTFSGDVAGAAADSLADAPAAA